VCFAFIKQLLKDKTFYLSPNFNEEQNKNPQRMEIQNIAGYQRVDLKWIVKDGNKFTVRIEGV
jgi:hypothetical protein